MIPSRPKTDKQLEALILKVATPMITKLAAQKAEEMVKNRLNFRSKKETATAQSSYEQRSYRGNTNTGVNSIAAGGIKVTGSRGNASGDIPALTSLLKILDGLNIVIDDSIA